MILAYDVIGRQMMLSHPNGKMLMFTKSFRQQKLGSVQNLYGLMILVDYTTLSMVRIIITQPINQPGLNGMGEGF